MDSYYLLLLTHTQIAQIYCIFLFLFSASLFGTLISHINEIIAQHTSTYKELDEILEAYIDVKPR